MRLPIDIRQSPGPGLTGFDSKVNGLVSMPGIADKARQ